MNPENVGKAWKTLAGAGGTLLAVIYTFLVPPPTGPDVQMASAYVQSARFTVIIAVGLLLVLGWRTEGRRWMWFWWLTAACTLALFGVSFYRYQLLVANWTCPYHGHITVVGSPSTYTDTARNYLTAHRGDTVEDMVKAFAGKTAALWSNDQLIDRQLNVVKLYSICVFLAGLCMITTLEAFTMGARDRPGGQAT